MPYTSMATILGCLILEYAMFEFSSLEFCSLSRTLTHRVYLHASSPSPSWAIRIALKDLTRGSGFAPHICSQDYGGFRDHFHDVSVNRRVWLFGVEVPCVLVGRNAAGWRTLIDFLSFRPSVPLYCHQRPYFSRPQSTQRQPMFNVQRST
ncbi:hypothetical protein BDN72DRAFT_94830 [Pluteus cervinus]|uniref:Uncharacterized protein n=1 Tax=Pluteus cervinus TaxID=181527 RepID=A0ACD3ANY6_9AGAR|nr:hypothetical protein BDN72DRAFT_94830 [Pluteus cervinus]